MNFKNVVTNILADTQADAKHLVNRIAAAAEAHVEPLRVHPVVAGVGAVLGFAAGFLVGRI